MRLAALVGSKSDSDSIWIVILKPSRVTLKLAATLPGDG